MQKIVEQTISTIHHYCDKCGEQIYDYVSSRNECGNCESEFCDHCGQWNKDDACEFCPPALQEAQAAIDALWVKANADVQALWERKAEVRAELARKHELRAASKPPTPDSSQQHNSDKDADC